MAWLDGTGTVKARFVYGTRINVPEYMVVGTSTYRIVTDHLGSPRLVVDTSSGAVAQRLDYDEWGIVLADSNPGFQPFGFAGGLYDRDTGLVRFGARDYDATAGRWVNKDPARFSGGPNFYEYCLGNPVNGMDPYSLFAMGLLAKGVGYLLKADAQVAHIAGLVGDSTLSVGLAFGPSLTVPPGLAMTLDTLQALGGSQTLSCCGPN